MALLSRGNETPFDVFVVDNGSEDKVLHFLRHIQSLNPEHLHSISFSKTNRGIAPVQNEFWEYALDKYRFVGKIDNDIIVPRGWIDECARRIGADSKIGAMSLYHWLPWWAEDIEMEYVSLIESGNGRYVWTSHVGGNYLASSEFVKKIGNVVRETNSLKQGFTEWLYRGNELGFRHGFVYPFDTYFGNLALVDASESPSMEHAVRMERKRAKAIIEMKRID
jgi:cellulose synthase/poly-beta-1,6-N-acetylglucosamine synthase-like glycosyltransferase